MPPWHADPKHGEWLNDRRISQEAIDTIASWVDGGAREGDPKDLHPRRNLRPAGASASRMKRFQFPNNQCPLMASLTISI